MKVKLEEYSGAFSISLFPEDMTEMVLLARYGINSTKEILQNSVYADNGGSMGCYITIKAFKNKSSRIGRGKF